MNAHGAATIGDDCGKLANRRAPEVAVFACRIHKMLDCRIPLQHFGHSSVTTYRDLCEIYRVRGDAGLPP